MRKFTELYWQLDSTTKTNEKIALLVRYFESAPPADAAWAIWILAGNRLKRLMPVSRMSQWAAEVTELPDWLFAECYDRVGDLAETISLVLPPPKKSSNHSLAELIEGQLLPLQTASRHRQRQVVVSLWDGFEQAERFLIGKLVTGGLRVGVSQRLLQRALSQWSGIDATTIAHRMMGNWSADLKFYQRLINPDEDQATAISRPYPFFLANPLKEPDRDSDLHASENSSLPDCDFLQRQLGPFGDWVAEWKWDGIRAQVIKRAGEVFIWSRGEELITGQFPEVRDAAKFLPDGTVIDGEILAWSEEAGRPNDFQSLQKRLGRKKVGPKTLRDTPAVLLAFDLIEFDGKDIRPWSLTQRQSTLDKVIGDLRDKATRGHFLFPEMEKQSCSIQLPVPVQGNSWQEWQQQREQSQKYQAEGLMLKRKSSTYQVNRPVGDWWKWKVDPFTVDAVLIYAQRGHGRRASLYSDYTFALWEDEELVPFAKAYSGLTDKEIRQVDAYIRDNTVESFGPVRSVTPQLVFELAFENIQISTRHKSGIAVRFPRINRWRHDKQPQDADTLESIKAMIQQSQ